MTDKTKVTGDEFEKFIVSDEWAEIRGNARNSDELAEGVYKFASQHYEREIDELHEYDLSQKSKLITQKVIITELKAHIEVLREALRFYAEGHPAKMTALGPSASDVMMEYDCGVAIHALSATTTQSLQEFETEVIERCAKVCDGYTHGTWFAKSIRALKCKV